MSDEADFFQTFVRLRSRASGELLVPEELRPRLVAEAQSGESNLTETTIRILSKVYAVPFVPTGRKTSPSEDGWELNLRLPMPLYRAIHAAAGVHPRSVQREILAALCQHFGLRLTKPPRRGRKPGTARAAA